jgi:hypothetical protein
LCYKKKWYRPKLSINYCFERYLVRLVIDVVGTVTVIVWVVVGTVTVVVWLVIGVDENVEDVVVEVESVVLVCGASDVVVVVGAILYYIRQ